MKRCTDADIPQLLLPNRYHLEFLATVWSPTPSIAQEPLKPTQEIVTITARRNRIEIVERFSKIIELKTAISSVRGFDPNVVSVDPESSHHVRVTGMAQGVTTLTLTDKDNNTFFVDIFVKGDTRLLQAIINSQFPDAAVETYKVQDSVMLRGWVNHPPHINQIVEISEQFFPTVLNHMSVGGVQQVALKVKILEVQRSKIREFGFNFLYQSSDGFFRSTPGQLVTIDEAGVPFSAAAFAFGFIGDTNVFNGFFEALKAESLLKILAEPELVTTNGRPAFLLSGGEFPILVPQGLGVATIEFREFGVRLEAVPIILGGGRLRLELQPEVSERDFSSAINLNGTVVPGLTTRRINTQVEMNFGQTLMIAGLISSRMTSTTSKVPFLGDLPFVGAAFRRMRNEDVETELVIMVTPELVAPLQPDQVPTGGPGLFSGVPTDRELFEGFPEVPNFGDPCEDCPNPYSQSVSGTRYESLPLLGGEQPVIVPAPEPPLVPATDPKSTQRSLRINTGRNSMDPFMQSGKQVAGISDLTNNQKTRPTVSSPPRIRIDQSFGQPTSGIPPLDKIKRPSGSVTQTGSIFRPSALSPTRSAIRKKPAHSLNFSRRPSSNTNSPRRRRLPGLIEPTTNRSQSTSAARRPTANLLLPK